MENTYSKFLLSFRVHGIRCLCERVILNTLARKLHCVNSKRSWHSRRSPLRIRYHQRPHCSWLPSCLSYILRSVFHFWVKSRNPQRLCILSELLTCYSYFTRYFLAQTTRLRRMGFLLESITCQGICDMS